MSSKPRDAWLRDIEAFARECLAGRETAHDTSHLERVVANARRLVAAEREDGRTADEFVVVAACWLHDVVQLPKGAGPPGESARRSAAAARELLARLGVTASDIESVAHAIEAHSFSGGLKPSTLEAAIVQDADRLDALGAIGIARFWVSAAHIGGHLYDPTDPLARHRALDDRAYALDHIEKKLLRLPELMTTPSGRVEATQRADFLRTYREQFLAELGWDALPDAEPANPIAAAIAAGRLAGELIYPGVPTPTVPAAAAALGVGEEQIIKTLAFVASDGSVVLAITTGPRRVNRQRLAEISGRRGLKLASPELVLEHTGYPAGGVPPVCHRTSLPVIVDRHVVDADFVYGGGGSDQAMLRIRPAEILRLTGATVAEIAE